jgi:hypothetical protein
MADDLADDLMEGIPRIARFLGKNERQIYHLGENKQLPMFKIGGRWHARKSALRKAIEDLERGAEAV